MTSAKKEVKKTAAPGFVTKETEEQDGPNRVHNATPVQAFLVQYSDGAGKKSVRLVFKVPGTKSAFILQEKIQGSFVATEATSWFAEALDKKLREKGLVTGDNTGSEGAESV